MFKITAITATYNRHYHLERVVKCFLDQDYEGETVLLIYNNNPAELKLDSLLPLNKKEIILVNNSKDLITGAEYKSLGAIYRDALLYVPDDTDIVCFMDDDDIFLPNHISEGVKGVQRANQEGKIAYKPLLSYFKERSGRVKQVGNNMEPSVFFPYSYLVEKGFKDTTVDQHLSWYAPLVDEGKMLIDETGPSTLIYCWQGEVFKTSGNPGNPHNFFNCRRFKGEQGDGIISPFTDKEIAPHYKLN